MPFFSIIVPVYNVEKYLSLCLDSLRNQTFPDIEVICVDDGSADGSLSIAEMHAALDSRIEVFTKANGGVSSARNYGFEKASGEYVLFSTFTIPGAGDVRVAVVSGLGNARRLMQDIDAGRAQYDFVEVMACPGGCAGGGGQPIHDGCEMAERRGEVLWNIDRSGPVRFSHENPDVQALYRDYLIDPLSHKGHYLLHTDHDAWNMPNQR